VKSLKTHCKQVITLQAESESPLCPQQNLKTRYSEILQAALKELEQQNKPAVEDEVAVPLTL